MFTPTGVKIGDSIITQAASGQGVTINGALEVVEDLNVTGSIETSSSLAVNETATLYGPLEVNSTYYDAAGDEGTDGDVLIAKGTPGNMATRWVSKAGTGIVTGSGTLNTIAMFTPDGQAIGDSPMFKLSGADWIQVGVVGSGQETVLGPGFVSTTVLGVTNVQAADGGSVTLQGNVEIGNASTDTCIIDSTVTFYGPVKDRNNALGTTSQILVSNASSQLEWDDATDVVSGAVAKLIPFQVTASAGGSSTYSADNNIVEIGWTGGNGTYALNIPSATTIPYRNIRFVTNSTFPNGASDKVQITAQAGETIDGAAFFEISKQYEGVSIWSNGTEWIVIQAKAH